VLVVLAVAWPTRLRPVVADAAPAGELD
jgi:hypothetical protein